MTEDDVELVRAILDERAKNLRDCAANVAGRDPDQMFDGLKCDAFIAWANATADRLNKLANEIEDPAARGRRERAASEPRDYRAPIDKREMRRRE